MSLSSSVPVRLSARLCWSDAVNVTVKSPSTDSTSWTVWVETEADASALLLWHATNGAVALDPTTPESQVPNGSSSVRLSESCPNCVLPGGQLTLLVLADALVFAKSTVD